MLRLSSGVENQDCSVDGIAVSPKLVNLLFDLPQSAIEFGAFGSQGGHDVWFGHAL